MTKAGGRIVKEFDGFSWKSSSAHNARHKKLFTLESCFETIVMKYKLL